MMGIGRSLNSRILLAGMVVFIMAWDTFCRAQAQVVVVQEAVAVQVQLPGGEATVDPDEEEEAVENEAPQRVQPVFMMNDDQFDQWIFGGPRNSGAGRNKLDTLLTLQVDDVSRACGLSELQKKKLLLAGHGDIKRFFDRVDEKRRKFDKVKNDQNKIGEIYQELQPLQMALNSGLFSEGSIFAKTLKKVLAHEQASRYEAMVREKRLFRYRAKIELIVASLDQTVGFSDDQRRALIELILRETEVPKKFGQYDYWLVMYQTGKIPESKLKMIFDDKQWGFMNRQLNQMRGMEQFLRNNGMLPENEAPAFVGGFIDALKNAPAGNAKTERQELPDDVFADPAKLESARNIERRLGVH
jgi:hypothetical protein